MCIYVVVKTHVCWHSISINKVRLFPPTTALHLVFLYSFIYLKFYCAICELMTRLWTNKHDLLWALTMCFLLSYKITTFIYFHSDTIFLLLFLLLFSLTSFLHTSKRRKINFIIFHNHGKLDIKIQKEKKYVE